LSVTAIPPPTLTLTHAPDGTNGFHRSFNVEVALVVDTHGVGLSSLPQCGEGATPVEVDGSANPFTVQVFGDGDHLVTCYAVDAHSVLGLGATLVRIDTTAPGATVQGPTTGLLDPIVASFTEPVVW